MQSEKATGRIGLVSELGTGARKVGARRVRLMGAVMAVAIPAAGVMAGTETWTGAVGPNWADGGNWVGDNLPPVAGDLLIFAGTTNLATNNNLAANTSLAGLTFGASAGAFTLAGNGVVLAGDVNNNSAAAQTISLPVFVDGGTVNVNRAGGGALSFGQVTLGLAAQSANVSTLNFNGSASATGLRVQTNAPAASPNTIGISAGSTLSVGGSAIFGTPATTAGSQMQTHTTFSGGGDLVVTGGTSNFLVGQGDVNLSANADRNVARVDLRNLGNFTFNVGATGTGILGVGRSTRPDGQLRMTPGTNTIVAAQVQVGDSTASPGLVGTGNNNSGVVSRLFLGTGTNVINTGTLQIGNAKAAGSVEWEGASGSVVIGGQAGGTSTANISIGRQSSATGTNTTSQLVLAGHQATVNAGTVTVGHANGATAAATIANGALTFDTGTFTAANLAIANNQSGANGGAIGAVTVGTNASSTGVLTVNSQFLLGTRTNATNAPVVATFTLNGGTANVNTNIQFLVNSVNGGDNSTLTLNGGTLNMGAGRNIGAYGAPIKNVNLAGGTLNSTGLVVANTITVSQPLNLVGTPTLAIAAGGTLNNTTGSAIELASGVTLRGDAGTSTVSGDVTAQSGSRVAPGSTTAAGTLQFNNNLTLAGGSTLAVKLSPTSGSGNDLLAVSGNLTLGGAVNLEIGTIGTGATIGETYTVATYGGGLTGNQTNVNVIGPGSRKTFTVLPTAGTPGSIQLSVGGQEAQGLTYLGNAGATWTVGGGGPLTWRNNGTLAADRFFNADSVTFDDTSTNAAAVTIVGQVSPASVNVSAGRNYTFTGSGGITGGTGLNKGGSGTLVLATDNSYVGTTTVNAGTLQVGNGGTSGTLGTGNVDLGSLEATLVFNRSDTTTAANVIGGAGSVVVDEGTVVLSGVNTYAGATSISAGGRVVVTNNGSLAQLAGGAVNVASGGVLDLSGNTTANQLNFGQKQFNIVGVGAGAGAIVNDSGVNQQNGLQRVALTGNATVGGTSRFDIRAAQVDGNNVAELNLNGHTLTKIGTNQFTLVATNVTDGNIQANQGILAIESTTSIPDLGTGTKITYNGATAQFFANSTDGGGQSFVKRPMVLAVDTLLGNNSNTAATIGSPITLQGNMTTRALNANGTGMLTLQGNISGPGGITKQNNGTGTNTLVLSGTNTYAGSTVVSGGTVTVNGSQGNSDITIATGATVNGSGTLIYNLAGDVGDLIANGGTFDISALNLSLNITGNQTMSEYVIANNAGGTLVGSAFASVLGLPSGGALDYDGTDAHPNSIVLTLPNVSIPGDADGDGDVDLDDQGIWAANFTGSLTPGSGAGTFATGDFDGDKDVDLDDQGIWAANFTGSLAPSGLITVPEPASLGLVGAAVVGLMARRRRVR